MRVKKNNKPITKGVAKVPVVIQLEALECGAACLTMILEYYNKWIPLEQVRYDCGVSRDGSNAKNILDAARMYGFEANGYKFEVDSIREDGVFPCIIHWNFNHFVVLDGFKKNKVYLNDPARGNYTVSMETFDESFTGIALLMEPGPNFVQSGEPKSIMKFVMKKLKGLKPALIFSFCISIISAIIGVINPIFNRIFYDRLLNGLNPGWIVPFLVTLGVFYFIQIVFEFVNRATDLKINGKITTEGSLSYVWKVLHLPMEFFSQRSTGDIASRQSANVNIGSTLLNLFAPLFMDSFMLFFYLILMFQYSWILSLIGLASMGANMLISRYISKQRLNLSKVQSRDNAKLYSSTIAAIQLSETIKSSGAETGFLQKWTGYYANTNMMSQKYYKGNTYLSLIPSTISTITSSLITGMGIYLIMTGSFTIGILNAFMGFFSSFTGPFNSIINASNSINEMRNDMEKIEDVMNYPEDTNSTAHVKDITGIKKLTGSVDVDNVTFGYSRLGEPIIKDFSVHIKPGQCVAFVGSSGCGKSTLAKLISGLYNPWSGNITFDGKKIIDIGHDVFTSSVSVVDQDIILFNDTVSNNIKMWDNSIEDFEVYIAAKDAQIHDDILKKDGGYQHVLQDGGKDFSGGQRQRLEIARVLAEDPVIIILDEATSALDAKTEYEVVKSIKQRGITCIVVAHRLSTIRDCDEIVVLDKGVVVERGKHDDLVKLNGYYMKLVSND